MPDRGTAKAGKDSKGIERGKKIEEEKQAKLTLEVGQSGKRVALAMEKEMGVRFTEIKEWMEGV